MNKEQYKRAFSLIDPSDEALERILNMTQTSKRKINFKPLLVAAVVSSLLLGTMFSVGASSDGKVSKLPNGDGEEKKQSVYLNGKALPEEDYEIEHKTTKDEDGNTVHTYDFKTIGGESIGDKKVNEYKIELDDDFFVVSYIAGDEPCGTHIERKEYKD